MLDNILYGGFEVMKELKSFQVWDSKGCFAVVTGVDIADMVYRVRARWGNVWLKECANVNGLSNSIKTVITPIN